MILNKHPATVVWLLLLCFSLNSNAASQLDHKQSAETSQHITWHRLLHYQRTTQGFTSQVDDSNFFLSPTGKHDPQAELNATLAAFYEQSDNPSLNARCRFPARWEFLQTTLSLSEVPDALENCPELSQWLTALNPNSISLIFASSYLNSPSSMFGHTFLRVDPPNIETGSTWLSHAINFGAETHSEDNSILYAYKGLFGGYPGFFSVIRYYEKIKEYSRIENRDLWEYNLNLTPTEARNLILHLWELRNINFDYYFFDENCSYRLLELLEYARPGISLRDDFALRAIPIDTVRAVINSNLVESVVYRPAITTKLKYNINQLSPAQQKLTLQLATGELELEDSRLISLPPAVRAQIIATSYDYFRYQQLHRQRDPQQAEFSLQLLQAVSHLPLEKTSPPIPNVPPDQGHKTLLFGLSSGNQEDEGFTDIRVRMSYHDLADNQAGYLHGAAINLGELKLRKPDSDPLRIESLSLVSIDSHSPQDSFFKPITWRVQAGFERLYSTTDDDLVAQVHGGAGVTYGLGEQVLVYGMAMARLEYNELLDHNWALGVGALAGGLVYLPFGTLQLESDYYRFNSGVSGDRQERYRHQLIQNIPIGRDNAVRLAASQQQQVETRIDEFSVEFRHYF